MRSKIYFLFFLLFSSISAFAQPANDDCTTAQAIGVLPAPAACPSGVGAALNIAGTLTGATEANPYVYQPGCSGAGGPNMAVPANDVWYTFTASGYQAVITINSTFANPNIAMYSGNCAALGGGVGGCAVGTGGTVTLTVEQMVPGTTYYVQVSGNTGQTGTFNMIIKNNQDCADCLNASTFTASPLPVNGMYTPGQVVNFCYHVAQYTQINTNWLHGIQLAFGSGWNLASLTTSPPASCAGTGTWAYYPGGCTGSATGVHYGPGFYFNYATPADGNPGNNFGDNCSGPIAAGAWTFCFTIAVANGCSPGSNLSVTVNTSGDGESGSWSNAGCLDDPASVINAVGSCCQPTMASTAATCAGNDGSATATPVGVSGPYDYVWTNSGGAVVSSTTGVAGANTATGLAPGVYTVSLTNTALNCVVTNTVTVTGSGTPPTPTAGSNSPVCVGSTLNLTSTTVAGATYAWTGPNSFTSIVQNPGIPGVTAAAAGVYTVTATIGTCSSTSTVNVTINTAPTVTVPANITVCNGGAIPATAFTSTPTGATFGWTNSNTAIGLGANGIGNIAAFTGTNATANPITATITVTPTAGCPGISSSYTITVNPVPTVVVPANSTVCNGGTIAATNFTSPTPGASFTWTNSNPAIGLAGSGVGDIAAFAGANATASPITATITVTPTANTCPGTPGTYTITVNPVPTVAVPANIAVCDGGNIAATNFTSPTPGATYMWTNSNTAIGLGANGIGNIAAFNGTNATGSSISGTVTVTPSANGCPGTPSTYTITVNPVPTVTAPANIIVCNGGNVTATNFTSPVAGATFSWTNSNPAIGIGANGAGNIAAFTATNAGTAPITATITVTPNAGCPGPTSSYTITVNPTPAVVVPADIIVCDGAAIPNMNFTSPVAGASFGWTNTNTAIGIAANGIGNIAGYTASNATGNPVNATVTVMPAANGCPGTPDSYDITINPVPTVTVPASSTVCNGSTVPATSFTSPVTGAAYSWTNSNPSIGIPASGVGDIASFTATNTGSAAVTATITVTPSAGCPGTPNSYTITVNPTPTVVVPANITVCDGVNIPATNFTSPVAGASFGWTNSNTAIGLGANGPGNVPAFNGTNPGAAAITATITVVPLANTCTGTPNSYTITINPMPVVNAGPDDTICFGGSTVLNATPNGGTYSYSWAPGTGLSSTTVFNPVANPAVTTNYTITTTLNGCSGSDNVTVYADPQIIIAKTAINVSCNGACDGQTIVIPNGGSNVFSYSWTGGCNTASCSGLCPGLYTVIVTDSWGCTATADTSVTEPPLLTVAITAQTPASCNGICDGTATAAANGGSPGAAGYAYLWNTVPAQNTAAANALCAGPHTVTVTDPLGCQANTSVTITEPTPVVVQPISPVTICIGSSTTITALPSGGNGGYNYGWLPAGTGGNVPSVTVSPIVTTTYTVNVTDQNGCAAPAITALVNVNPPLNVTALGTTSVCPGSSAPISAVAGGGDGNYTYIWTPAGTPPGTPVLVTPAATTDYTVTVTDGCGTPSATDHVIITVLPLPNPVFSANITSGCAPLCVNFTDASTIPGGSIAAWEWDFGDGGPNDVTQNPSHCFPNPGLYSITLTDTSAAGCHFTFTNTNMIDVFALPDAEFSAAPNPASVLNSEVSFTDLTTSASPVSYWEWIFGDGDSLGTSTPDPVHAYPNETAASYIATLIVHNTNGCYDTVAHGIDVGPEFTFFIPNAFTPNGDGINDYFNGAGIGITKYEMMVFDRWGNMIFDTESLGKPWDGKANAGSEMAQQDVYVWKVKLTDVFDKKHNYIGTVTIVK
jgi:gliding motility-associated-like protein